MVLRQFGFSVENFSALADLEVKLGQTWSQHGPNMVLNIEIVGTCLWDQVDSVLKISQIYLVWK